MRDGWIWTKQNYIHWVVLTYGAALPSVSNLMRKNKRILLKCSLFHVTWGHLEYLTLWLSSQGLTSPPPLTEPCPSLCQQQLWHPQDEERHTTSLGLEMNAMSSLTCHHHWSLFMMFKDVFNLHHQPVGTSNQTKTQRLLLHGSLTVWSRHLK